MDYFFCNSCGSKITDNVIFKRSFHARISQTTRWQCHYQCNKCNKHFDYKYLQKHKELFKNTLLTIKNN